MVFGPQTYHKLAEMVADATDAYGKNRVINTDFPVEQKFDYLPEEREPAGASAFVSIQEGCDKFCTFCVVPYTRGAEYSRDVDQIIAECQAVIRSGAKEIQLLGQNVNAYHGTGPDGKTWGLADLIRAVADQTDIERIRYTTSHPRDMDDDLIKVHGEVEQLMPMLHLPVQSGSDDVLKRMNRQHTGDDYRRIIDDLRIVNPDLVFSSDFIVGFPGETDADFEDTMQLVRDVGFASAYSFAYSPRPGTPAANMKNLVPPKVQKERLHELQDLLTQQQVEFNKSTIGNRVKVLFDRPGKEDDQLLGRTPHMQSIYAKAPDRLMNEIVEVEITGAYRNSVSGNIITHEIEGPIPQSDENMAVAAQ
jgi:tRNA-2-methylthio-N6-dimethylallyladenosine synthase